MPQAGEGVGHFVVEQVLGIGGMGVVLRAHDEHLDRSVALKLVRPELGGSHGTRGTERLLVEARAMAKISHPNVITVHEVGVVEGQVFLAMEFIDGQTLGEWVEAETRTWPAIVNQWIAAGRGLVAAHEAGLVHRDFKPANVLVSRDERILVTDFGIAGADSGSGELADADASDLVPLDELDLSRQVSRLTETGGLLGTPRYMAPEQFAGLRVDARADQFAFCVTLWEAVFGRHPFDSSSLAALALAASTGALREPPRGHGVPDRLRRILTRGLATQPDDRHPDMRSLLGALEGLQRSRARRRWLVPLAITAPVLAGLAWALWPKPPDPCAPDESRWDGVWDADIRAEIAEAMANADAPYIGESAPQVTAELDTYVSAWDEHEQRACADTRVRETVSEQMLDRRMRCLDSRRRRFAALTDAMRQGEPELLAKALEVVGELPALDDCDDLAQLEADIPLPPPEIRDELARFDEDLAKADTMQLAGKSEPAVELLDSWGPRLAELDDPHSEAQRLRTLAEAWTDRDNIKACDYYRQAYAASVAAGAVWLATMCARKIASCKPDSIADDHSEFWLEVAAGGYAQLERPLDFQYYTDVASVRHQRRDFEGTVEALEHALTLIDDEAEQGKVLKVTANLGAMYGQLRRFDESNAYLEQAIATGETLYGPHHPSVLSWRANVVAMKVMQGKDFEGVLREGKSVLEAQEAGLGPDAGILAVTLTVMGVAARQLDLIDDATAYDSRAYEIRKHAYGANHWMTIESLEKLGRDHVYAERYDEGVDQIRAVIDGLAENHGPEHLEVGRAWTTLGWALSAAERPEEAVEAHRKGVELMLAADPDYPTLYQSYLELGVALLEAGEHAEAEAALVHALELSADRSPPPRTKARMLLRQAEARRAMQPKDERALELARSALELLDAEDPKAELREEIEAFLATRP